MDETSQKLWALSSQILYSLLSKVTTESTINIEKRDNF